jgi:hypothetical protein
MTVANTWSSFLMSLARAVRFIMIVTDWELELVNHNGLHSVGVSMSWKTAFRNSQNSRYK